MLHFFSRLGCLVTATCWLSGCANSPSIAEANIPLIPPSPAFSSAPSTDIVAIKIPTYNTKNNTLDTIAITVNDKNYVATKQYVSASGQKCIRFAAKKSVSNVHNEKRTACQKAGQWVLLKQLVASTNSKANN